MFCSQKILIVFICDPHVRGSETVSTESKPEDYSVKIYTQIW
jgi:hypothetical protein